jgi:bacterioferritin-associated ferredoxin
MKSKCFFCGRRDQTVLEELKLPTGTVTLCGNCARKLSIIFRMAAGEKIERRTPMEIVLEAIPPDGVSMDELREKVCGEIGEQQLKEVVKELMGAGVIYMPRKNYIARV